MKRLKRAFNAFLKSQQRARPERQLTRPEV
jgi:hypothetical protein